MPNSPPEAQPLTIVLGIDPGLTVCGWGVVRHGGSPVYVGAGAIRPRPREPITRRLVHLHDAITAVIAEYGPTEVAIEEPFVGALLPQAALAIGQARAAAVLAAGRAGLDVSFYAPAAVKTAVAGYGQSDKRQVQTMVRLILGLAADPEPFDAADALAVALTHLSHRKARALVSPAPASGRAVTGEGR